MPCLCPDGLDVRLTLKGFSLKEFKVGRVFALYEAYLSLIPGIP